MDGVKIDYKKILEIVLIGIGCYWALNNFQIIIDNAFFIRNYDCFYLKCIND